MSVEVVGHGGAGDFYPGNSRPSIVSNSTSSERLATRSCWSTTTTSGSMANDTESIT
jgi:hypothetical protein